VGTPYNFYIWKTNKRLWRVVLFLGYNIERVQCIIVCQNRCSDMEFIPYCLSNINISYIYIYVDGFRPYRCVGWSVMIYTGCECYIFCTICWGVELTSADFFFDGSCLGAKCPRRVALQSAKWIWSGRTWLQKNKQKVAVPWPKQLKQQRIKENKLNSSAVEQSKTRGPFRSKVNDGAQDKQGGIKTHWVLSLGIYLWRSRVHQQGRIGAPLTVLANPSHK